MAAEVGQPYSGWSSKELSDRDQLQDISVSRVLDHGSISFGKFAIESLSWEKRSVFTHDKHQEELSKLTCPGLVAQKKAYFEEYYKRIRTMKTLEENPQTETALDHSGDGSTSCDSSEANELVRRQLESHEEEKILMVDHLSLSNVSLGKFEEEKDFIDSPKQDLDASPTSDSAISGRGQQELRSIDDGGISREKKIVHHNGDSLVAAPAIGLSTTSSKPKGSERVKVDKPEIKKTTAAIRRSALKKPAASLNNNSRSDVSRKTQNKSSNGHNRLIRNTSKEDTNRRIATNSKSSSVSSHKPFGEVRSNVTVPHPFSFATERRAALASSNSDSGVRLNAKVSKRSASSVMEQKNTKIASDTTKKTARSIGATNKIVENKRGGEVTRKLVSARSAKDTNLLGRDLKVSGLPKPKSLNLPSHGGSNPNGVNKKAKTTEEKKPKEVVSSRISKSLLNGRKALNSDLSLNKRKPRQEKPRWR